MDGLDRHIRGMAREVDAVQDRRPRLIPVLPEEPGLLANRFERVPRAQFGREEVETGQDDLVEHPPHLIGGGSDADRHAHLGGVALVAGGELVQDQVAPLHAARRGAGVAEDHPGPVHRGRADDQEVDLAAAFEDRARRGGLERVLRHARLGRLDHRQERRGAEVAGPPHPLQLGGALGDQKLVKEVSHELERGLRQPLGQGPVLVHRQIVTVPRVDDRDADPSPV